MKMLYRILQSHSVNCNVIDDDDDDNVQWFNVHLKADWKPA